jgi:hypothetical protein
VYLLHARSSASVTVPPQARAGGIKARESASDRAKRGCGLEAAEHAGTIGKDAERGSVIRRRKRSLRSVQIGRLHHSPFTTPLSPLPPSPLPFPRSGPSDGVVSDHVGNTVGEARREESRRHAGSLRFTRLTCSRTCPSAGRRRLVELELSRRTGPNRSSGRAGPPSSTPRTTSRVAARDDTRPAAC